MQQETLNYLLNGLFGTIFICLGVIIIGFAVVMSAMAYDMTIDIYRRNRIK